MEYVVIKLERPDDQKICDFCSASPVYACHAAYDFIDPATKGTKLVSESKGAWAACEVCDRLIRTEDWKALAQRSAEEFFKKYGEAFSMPFEAFQQEMYNLQQEFKKHRILAA